MALAGAIQTPVFGANAAGFFQPFAQGLPRAMAADFQIVAIDAELFGHLRGIAVREFHPLN